GCFDPAGVLDPGLKKCASAADCVIVDVQRDCCGTQRAAGVATANKAKVEKCAADRAASLPKCGCPTGPAVADDGTTQAGASGVTPSLVCNGAGLCETSFKGEICGATTCKPGATCCSGPPLPSPTCYDNGLCPISQRKLKKDITYLSEADRARLNDELLRFPLATYRYTSEGETDREHLGFIIDDVAPSAAVQQSGERVDMYGYQTMAVAALQVQARELATLRRELDELKATCAAGAKKR
ncbi:MAG TPA: tail fiber domain-containing protein, partial [Labilithrix sp.]|nr:tail fiber domain-containing protein [Labilithrix sp.]